MAAFDANRERYVLGGIDGKIVTFTNMRIDRQIVPKNSDRLCRVCEKTEKASNHTALGTYRF